MMLIEADAKQILADHGMPVPGGRGLVRSLDEMPPIDHPVAIKAQLLAGGRGKSGLVRLSAGADVPDALAQVHRAMTAAGHHPLIMIEDQVEIARELFLAWRIDDVRRVFVLMFSAHGGVDVESHADSLRELDFAPGIAPRAAPISAFLAECGLDGRAMAAVTRFALDLHAVMVRADATLIEINPLALTPRGTAIALDAKITLDENAAARHGEWRRLASWDLQATSNDPLEMAASAAGITFVTLPGEVALITGGAGIGMTLVDLLGDAGYAAANFVDVPGGSGARVFSDLTTLVMRRAAAADVKAVVIFLTLSATSLKQPVESILAVLDTTPVSKPIVVGLVAGGSAEREMTLAEAKAAFRLRGHDCVDDLDSAVAAVVAALGR